MRSFLHHGPRGAVALAAVVAGLAASPPALSNWLVRELVNNSGQIVTVGVPLGAGRTMTGLDLDPRGDLVIVVPEDGALNFKDMGSNTVCPNIGHGWWVDVTYHDREWRYFYDGEGRIDVTIGANGDVSLANSGVGTVVDGDGC